jgi:hypothetical protein
MVYLGDFIRVCVTSKKGYIKIRKPIMFFAVVETFERAVMCRESFLDCKKYAIGYGILI